MEDGSVTSAGHNLMVRRLGEELRRENVCAVSCANILSHPGKDFGLVYDVRWRAPVIKWIRDDQPMIVRSTQEKSSRPFKYFHLATKKSLFLSMILILAIEPVPSHSVDASLMHFKLLLKAQPLQNIAVSPNVKVSLPLS